MEPDELEAKKRALSAFDPEGTMQGIAQIESSGGKFRDHPMNQSGLQKGTKSVSSYGLMPNTVYEFTKRSKEFQSTPEGQRVLQTQGNPEAINSITQDTNSDDAIMKQLLVDQDSRLKPHYEGSPVDAEMANVLANRRGVNGAIKSIQNGSYQKDPYLQKFLQLRNKLKPVS